MATDDDHDVKVRHVNPGVSLVDHAHDITYQGLNLCVYNLYTHKKNVHIQCKMVYTHTADSCMTT